MNTASDLVKITTKKLLSENGMSVDYIEGMINKLCSSGVDFGDIFFMCSVSESWRLSEQKIKSGAFSIDQGFGVRGVLGEKTALAHSDEINNHSLHQAIRAARTLSNKGGSSDVRLNLNPSYKIYNTGNYDPINSIGREQKVQMLNEIDRFARSSMLFINPVPPRCAIPLSRFNRKYFTTVSSSVGRFIFMHHAFIKAS